MSGAAFAGWAVEALVASALLMGLVMLVRVPVRRAFGPGVAYLLWALPPLRLLLPPLPAGWGVGAAAPIARAGETATVLVMDSGVAAAATAPAGVSPGGAVALLWGTGAVAFLLFHTVRYARFRTGVLRVATPPERVGNVRVILSDAVPGPLAFGIWPRYVAFPRDVADRYDADERALALAHEVGHHQRGDLLANWLALAVLAVHWFNPLAWHAFRAFRCDQELANDARVLADRSPASRHAYGRAIVKATGVAVLSPACHFHTAADLKGRLKMLARSPTSRRRLASGATTVTLFVLAGLGLTASGTGAAAIAASVGNTAMVPVSPPALLATPAPAMSSAPTGRVKRVMVVRGGKARSYDGAAAEAYLAEHDIAVPPASPTTPASPVDRPAVVRVSTAKVGDVRCPGGDAAGPAVEHRSENGRRRVIICSNRIEALTRDAERTAADAAVLERDARASARANLTVARAAIERERNLTDDQRREALAGIAQAEAELASAD